MKQPHYFTLMPSLQPKKNSEEEEEEDFFIGGTKLNFERIVKSKVGYGHGTHCPKTWIN